MPMYEYECPKHGRFEVYRHRVSDRKEFEPCPIAVQHNSCCIMSETVGAATLTAIQPDSLWHGKYFPTLGMEFNSKSKLQGYLKATGRRLAEPGDSLQATRGKAKKAEKADKRRLEKVAETVKDFTDSQAAQALKEISA